MNELRRDNLLRVMVERVPQRAIDDAKLVFTFYRDAIAEGVIKQDFRSFAIGYCTKISSDIAKQLVADGTIAEHEVDDALVLMLHGSAFIAEDILCELGFSLTPELGSTTD